MLKTIRRWMNRSKLADARIERQEAKAACIDAALRKDTRDIHRTYIAFYDATQRVLELEG